ncbi:MAG: AAA family ATPase, partial [Actinobacteria bacterium]|nr:AAA family ATPase [Actinomycetota bacterium]
HKRVVSQEEAIKTVAKSIRRARSGLKDPRRPMGSFIFAGPSGVGKTLLSKALAEFMFGDEEALVQLDMSEYMEKHNVSRLIGAPPGYVGYEEGGQLTEAVRRRPYSVILLDEVEKAHPEVFNILLQVLDDGRLTDGQGRTVDFRNTILIMTSNLGSQFLVESGRDQSEREAAVMEVVRNHFKPEFINRLDDIVMFSPLGTEQLVHIVDLQLRSLESRIADRRLTLDVKQAAKDWLVEKGFDPIYGARPLRRLVQTAIGDQLAKQILSGSAPDGSTITVDAQEGKLTVVPEQG